MKKINLIILLIMLGSFSHVASAALLDFNDKDNLGVTLGGSMKWDSRGGGHLYNDIASDDDMVFFLTDTYINSFEMNARAWEGFTNINENPIKMMDIKGYNDSDLTTAIWETTVDLSNYTAWDNWLTVSVETPNITQLTFVKPGNFLFWPSIDNMVINEQMPQVPVPAAIWLFISGLIGLSGSGLFRRSGH